MCYSIKSFDLNCLFFGLKMSIWEPKSKYVLSYVIEAKMGEISVFQSILFQNCPKELLKFWPKSQAEG